MAAFTIRIAERVIEILAEHELVHHLCRDYLCAGEADFSVRITAEDIAYEQAVREQLGSGSVQPPDAYLEISALLRKISESLLEYDTLLFHGSVVAVDGIGYLFTAPSGTGKSTHTRLWRELLGERAVMVNDDKPFLKMTESGVLAHGSPWNGKHRLGENIRVPLKAICILERGTENSIRQIPAKEALVSLFQQSARPREISQIPRYMDLLDRLAQNVTFYRMCCSMAPEAARMAFEAMSGQTLE